MSAPEFPPAVEAAIARVTEALADGFDAEDVALLVREAVEVAEKLDDLDGPSKRAMAIAFSSDLVDKFFGDSTPKIAELVEAIDWPWLTDGMEKAIVDPIVLKFAVPYARDLVKLAIPGLVDLVVKATKGGVAVNAE